MSQKVIITKVRVKGATPYLGMNSNNEPIFSRDPEMIGNWLSSGWRTRYNQHRSTRRVFNKDHELVPLGRFVVDIKDSQARQQYSFLAAIPQMILQSPARIEQTQWKAARKRQQTLKDKGKKVGKLPGFRSYKRDDQIFTCWYHNGTNAKYRKLNNTHGVVVISGQNPIGFRRDGVKWKIELTVCISEPIRPYTSVQVNWTRKTLVFTNEPVSVKNLNPDAVNMLGVDMGAVHTVATSEGEFFDLPLDRIEKYEREFAKRQKNMARKERVAGFSNRRDYIEHGVSQAWKREREAARKDAEKIRLIRNDILQKISTALVQHAETIIIEKLKLQNMMKKVPLKPDPNHEGKYLPNGQSRKRRLNRVLQCAGLSKFKDMLAYKCENTPNRKLVEVNPAYTSQMCSQCGYVAKENRESQAVFHCHYCGFEGNADYNAAVNIKSRGIRILESAGGA